MKNPSFEESGKPSGKYWRIANYPGFQFHNSAPEGGGKWSVCLPGDWLGGTDLPMVYQTVPAIPGKQTYTMELWARKSTFDGEARLQLITADTTYSLVTFRIDSDTWKRYSKTVSLSARDSDSLRVVLLPGTSGLLTSSTCYDLVQLTQR
ncbi:MAG: hypothetical protein GXO78_07775 [Calditrichaeota bacterium]|nr:hypothetical protein [Calditrichota bacterium]